MCYWQVAHEIWVQLRSDSTRTRVPPGFDDALTKVCESKESPERRLLEKSVAAWACLLFCRNTSKLFNELSLEGEKLLLEEIQEISPSAATKDRMRQLFAPKQRQDLLKRAGLERLLDFEHAPTQGQKRKRREAPEEALNHIASPSKMETPVSERRDLEHPLPEHLRHIFHPRMCDRIVQRKGGAAVTIRYAADLTKCHLKITILRKSIPNLAIRLFGCTLEDTPTGWVLQVEQGPDVKSGRNGYFRISRASVDAVGLFIGTPIRELVDHGNEITTLLSLYVTGKPKSNGVIEVEAHADKLETIALKLWPLSH